MAKMQAASPPTTLLNFIAGAWVSQAVSVVARLGIADLLEAGPRSCAELARATKTHPDALYRVLRALASVGIFAEVGSGRFELTPVADPLRTNAAVSLRDFAVFIGEEWHWRAWGHLAHSVRTENSAFEHVFGIELFDYLAQQPEASQVFDAAMTSRNTAEGHAISAAYDFGRSTIVDVGGGRGALLAVILREHPEAHGILFDLPHVVAGGTALLGAAGVAERCLLVEGDFFEEVPAGGDIYVMKKVIHDWSDARAAKILGACRAAMDGKARLLLLEQVIQPGNAPAFGKLLDLEMLVATPGGRERTEAEYKNLLAAAGFELNRIVPTGCALDIIEAVPR